MRMLVWRTKPTLNLQNENMVQQKFLLGVYVLSVYPSKPNQSIKWSLAIQNTSKFFWLKKAMHVIKHNSHVKAKKKCSKYKFFNELNFVTRLFFLFIFLTKKWCKLCDIIRMCCCFDITVRCDVSVRFRQAGWPSTRRT